MFAGLVGFTAIVVSLCGPTLSQSRSALPANELGCPTSVETQATPEMPPPPGPFVPLAALSVKLMRSLSRRCFAEPASAVVAPTIRQPMTMAVVRNRGMMLYPPERAERITYARSREMGSISRWPHARPTSSEAYRSADRDPVRDPARGAQGLAPRPSRRWLASRNGRRPRPRHRLRRTADDGCGRVRPVVLCERGLGIALALSARLRAHDRGHADGGGARARRI